jgi:polygalacturonase
MLPKATWPSTSTPFINAGTITDVEISGSGTIDGQGSGWWPAGDPRPDFIQFIRCTRALIQNVWLQNAPTFHLMLKNNNVSLTIQNITINTSPTSPNTDGMDLGSSNVLIQGCSISCGDDNIEIGGSSAAALDITISNCTFGTGHGVSLGSLVNGSGGGVQNLLVSNCTFTGTDYGIRMKSDRDRGGVCQNLRYLDITMTNVGYAIVIYSYYNSVGTPNNINPFWASTDTVHTVTGTTPIWRNITIDNVTASGLTGSRIAGIIWGVPEMLVSNVTLSRVNIAAPNKTFSIYNARGIQIIDSNLTAPSTTNTLVLYNAEITVTNSAASTNLLTLGGLAKPPTNNTFVFFNAKAAITDTNMLGTGPITLGGSTLTFSQGAVSFSNNLNVVAASTLAVTSGSNTFSGALSGSGPLTFNLPGSSVLTLRGNSSGFSGTLVVSNSGTLLVNNTVGSGTGTGALTVLSSAALGGSGVIGGPVTVNGTLLPGNSPGTLTISNNLVVSGGAALRYDLGTNSDLTAVSGNLTLDGTLNITDAGGLTNTTYRLFNYGGTLTDNGLTVGTTPSTSFTYTVSTSTTGQVNLIVSSGGGTPPVANFTASPTNGTAPLVVTFTDASTGSITNRFWDFGDGNTTDFAAATNPPHTYAPGVYNVTLTVSGPGGDSSLIQTNLIAALTAFEAWQQQYFGCTNCPEADATADPDGDGLNNEAEFLSGTSPTNSVSALRILSAIQQTTDVVITWTTVGGFTNAVQATTGDAGGSYTTNFTDISDPILVLGSGDVTTNYTDTGGATNTPSRYYRVRLVP